MANKPSKPNESKRTEPWGDRLGHTLVIGKTRVGKSAALLMLVREMGGSAAKREGRDGD